MKINLRDYNLEVLKTQIDVPEFIFNSPIREDIIAQIIKWQLDKKRSGNASTKTRSDVSGTTRKPWGQKETGKARQGSLRSPHFRGGGVVFGPHPRSYEFKLNKKIRSFGLLSALSDRYLSDNVLIVDSFDFFNSEIKKTKDFDAWKKKTKLNSVLFIGEIDICSFRNIPYVNQLDVEGINVLSIIKHDTIIFDVESLSCLIEFYGGNGDDSNESLVDSDQTSEDDITLIESTKKKTVSKKVKGDANV